MSVEDKVKSIIVEQLGVDANEVTPEASFVDDPGRILLTRWSS
jgi:acyl carrier protein